MKTKEETEAGMWQKIKHSKYSQLSGLFCLIIVFSAVVQSYSGNFLTLANANNVLKEIVVYGILACALAFPLINGTFDLSIESISALGGTCCALLVTDGFFGIKTNLFCAVLISVFICCIFGAVNGLIVSRTKIDPFIVTLGTQTAIRGIVYIVCKNTAVTSLPKAFKNLSSGKIFGISISIYILIAVFVMVAVVLGKTTYGKKIYAIGGSYQAAFISGINVKRIRFSTYVISAGLACIAGVLSTARVGSATPNAGSGYAAIAISACAIGGVSLNGGKGMVLGVFLGALMMGMITNGMNLMFIGSNWQYVVRGSLMVLAVFYAQWFNRISSKETKKK